MRLPRVRITVGGMMVAVAAVAVVIVAPDVHLGRPENTLVIMVVGATALAIEKSRREVERARCGGEGVGRFRFLGRIVWNLPVGILIVVVCRGLNEQFDWTLMDITGWILRQVLSPGLSPHETYLAYMRIIPRFIACMDLGVAMTAFLLWDALGRWKEPVRWIRER